MSSVGRVIRGTEKEGSSSKKETENQVSSYFFHADKI